MIYVWRTANDEIKSFGETPYVLAEGETQEALDLTMEQYAARFTVTTNKFKIVANGTDEAIVTLHSTLELAMIAVWVNETQVEVVMSNGVGTLPPITSDVVEQIYIQPVDKTLFCTAGSGSLSVMAVEVL